MDFQRILPWIFISGLVFSLLSYVANKYHGRDRNIKELSQDFLGGSIFIGLLSAIVPDIFPDICNKLNISGMNIENMTKIFGGGVGGLSLASLGSTVGTATGVAKATDDMELQVGPLPGI
jgi:hypothetical protein